ncbi:MAG: toprim domain-containing protein [Candidatus Bathyarchaeia archaeon]
MTGSFSMERKLDQILRVLDDLASESAKGTPIIVEGRRDVDALNELKIRGRIIQAKSGGKNVLDLLSMIEAYGKDEVILLLDFDRRGRELTRYLTQRLEKMKIKPNTVFWRELSSFLRRDVKDIEGLSTYIKTLMRKIGKTSE